ncbi:MAG: hypothetical protein NTY15_12380 [Planctomycetota bacterium]|nr:hypothetical protein [Planctomycetota bacterium]
MLRSVGPTLISKRHVREWLIDEPTEFVIGPYRLIVHPSNCVMANVVHSENLLEQASRICKDPPAANKLSSTQSIALPSQENPSHVAPATIEAFDATAAARLDAIEKLLESLKQSLEKMQSSIGLDAKSSSESIVQSVTMEIDEFGKRLFTDLNKQLSSQSDVQESFLAGIADQLSGRFGAIDEQLNRFYESSTIQTSTLNELLVQATAEQQQIEARFQDLLTHRNDLMDAVQILRTEILQAGGPSSQWNQPIQTNDTPLVVDSGLTQNHLADAQTGLINPEFAEHPEYFESGLASTEFEDAPANPAHSSDAASPVYAISDDQLAHSLELAQVQIQELNLQLRKLERERDASEQRIASLSESWQINQEPLNQPLESNPYPASSVGAEHSPELPSGVMYESDSLGGYEAMPSADEPIRRSVVEEHVDTSKEPELEPHEAPKSQGRELPAWYKQDEPEPFPANDELEQSAAYSSNDANSPESPISHSTPDLSSYYEAKSPSETKEQTAPGYDDNSFLDSSTSSASDQDDSKQGDESSDLDSISDRLKRMLADAKQRRSPTSNRQNTSQSWSQQFNTPPAEIASEDILSDIKTERPEYRESPLYNDVRRSEATVEAIAGSMLQAAEPPLNDHSSIIGQGDEAVHRRNQEFEDSQATYANEPMVQDAPGQGAPNSVAGKTPSVGEELEEAEEESIEDYMQKLLNRVRGEAENSDPTAQAKIQATVAPPPNNPTSTSKPRSRVAASMGLEMEESLPPVSERLSEELFVPRQQAPEQRNDLAALRELANTNARRAISRSDIRKTNSAFFLKLGVTALAVFSAVALFLFNGFALNAPFAGMVAAIVVALLWGFDCVNHFKRLKNVGLNQATPAETAAGQSIRVGNSEEESGWRPTPA